MQEDTALAAHISTAAESTHAPSSALDAAFDAIVPSVVASCSSLANNQALIAPTPARRSPSRHLPTEILQEIFSYLSHRTTDLASCSRVSRHWYILASTLLWKSPNPPTLESMIKFGKYLEKMAVLGPIHGASVGSLARGSKGKEVDGGGGVGAAGDTIGRKSGRGILGFGFGGRFGSSSSGNAKKDDKGAGARSGKRNSMILRQSITNQQKQQPQQAYHPHHLLLVEDICLGAFDWDGLDWGGGRSMSSSSSNTNGDGGGGGGGVLAHRMLSASIARNPIFRKCSKWYRRRWYSKLLTTIILTCPSLRRLDLSNCGAWVTDQTLLRSLCNKDQPLPVTINLEEICLANCFRISDAVIKEVVRSCPNLKSLDLSNVLAVTNEGVAGVAEIINDRMRELDLTGCNITDEAVIAVANWCPSIISLSLENCFMLTEKSLTVVVTSCTVLEHVKLPCFVFPPGLPGGANPILESLLQGGTRYKSIGLFMCSVDLDRYLPSLLSRCPDLHNLDLSGCSRLTPFSIPSFASITHLNLTANGGVNDHFAETLARYAVSLTQLDLSHCKITTLGAGYLLANCYRLKWLSLSFNARIRMSKVRAVSVSLRHLALCQCPGLRDSCLAAIPRCTPYLNDLDISHCAGLTDPNALYRMVVRLPRLSRLDISYCDRLLSAACSPPPPAPVTTFGPVPLRSSSSAGGVHLNTNNTATHNQTGPAAAASPANESSNSFSTLSLGRFRWGRSAGVAGSILRRNASTSAAGGSESTNASVSETGPQQETLKGMDLRKWSDEPPKRIVNAIS
ncbi:hypothetical protein HK102_005556 [Quaeritorhiza haematococci]|nr:hypothetical protein HK102_005556 [Quaeritorhiza haematococci]